MDFLTQQEVKGIRQDIKNGQARLDVEKIEFEKQLRETFEKEIKEMMEDPKKFNKQVKFIGFAKKYEKKKKRTKWKENLKKIFGISLLIALFQWGITVYRKTDFRFFYYEKPTRRN